MPELVIQLDKVADDDEDLHDEVGLAHRQEERGDGCGRKAVKEERVESAWMDGRKPDNCTTALTKGASAWFLQLLWNGRERPSLMCTSKVEVLTRPTKEMFVLARSERTKNSLRFESTRPAQKNT